MANAKTVLSADDYKNYRNIRAIAMLFVLLGGLWALFGTILAVGGSPHADSGGDEVPAALFGVMAIAGALGAVGGVCTLAGMRRLAPLIYVFGVLYLFAFPIGTILGHVLLKGLRRYLDSVEQVRTSA